MSTNLTHLSDRFKYPNGFILVLIALMVGIASGIGAMHFRFLIRGVEWVAYDWFRSAAPALGLEWDRMPQMFNVGYDVIESTLQNQIMLCVVIPLLLLKLVATVITLGSGGSGRIFAPSLFMGAMLGSAFGVVVNSVAPFLPAPPGAYALVGIGPSRPTGRK